MAEQVALTKKEYYSNRAPQLSSKSISPYLLSSSFTFDVSSIIEEIKRERRLQLKTQKYSALNKQQLMILLQVS